MLLDRPDGTDQHRRSSVVLTGSAPAEAARALTAGLPWWEPDLVTVITPGPMAARAMGVAHRSLASLAVAELSARGFRFADALTRRAALQTAVEDAWGPNDAAGTARSVESTVGALLRAGAAGASSPAGYPRLMRLLELVEAYRDGLAARDMVDRSEALWLAASDARSRPRTEATPAPGAEARPTLLVVGYSLLAADELAFVARHAAAGSLVVLPQAPRAPLPRPVASDAFAPNEEAAAALAERGWLVLRDDGDGAIGAATDSVGRAGTRPAGSTRGDTAGHVRIEPPAPPSLRGFRLDSLEAEVRFVLTEVKALLLDGVPVRDIALVAADPRSYGPVVLDVAREYGVAVRPTYGVPLAATRLGSLVASVAGVVAGSMPFEETARLLSQRLTRPLTADQWNRARGRHPRNPSQWRAIDERTALLVWPRRASRSEFGARLEDTLRGLGTLELLEDDATSRHHLDLLVKSLAAYSDRVEAAAGPRREASVTLAAYIAELQEHLQLVTYRWAVRGAAATEHVPLVSASEVAGATVRHVFVVGAAEGTIPARLDPGARLDFVEREVARRGGLAVPNATLAASREALTFDALVRSARSSLTLTYPESGQRNGQLASPYFASLGLVPHAPASAGQGAKPAASLPEFRRRLLAAGDQSASASDAVLARARRALAVESRRESGEPPDEFDGIIGEPYPTDAPPFSATSLLALGQCTFRWFAQYALTLYEPEEAEDELSALIRGNLYHHALDNAFKAVMNANTASGRPAGDVTPEALSAALPAAFAEAEVDGAVYTANWQVHRDQHLSALQRVVRAESFLPGGTEVVGTETRFGARYASPTTWRGFEVSGRIDRIDSRAGRLTLVDYKTSSNKPPGVQDASGELKVDLQLPIYLEAAVPALELSGSEDTAQAAPAAAEYYSLTKSRVIASTSLAGPDAFDDAAVAAFASRAHAALERGRYPVEPDRAREACAYCAFDAVCRVGPRIERKRGAGG